MGREPWEEQNAAEVTSEEVLDGGCMGAAGTEHLLLYCLSLPLTTPPKKNLGPIFLTLHICFWVGGPLSFFCPETLDKTLHLGGEENCLNHTNDDFVCNT